MFKLCFYKKKYLDYYYNWFKWLGLHYLKFLILIFVNITTKRLLKYIFKPNFIFIAIQFKKVYGQMNK